MSITKFPAAFAAAYLVWPCAPAQTETRLPEAPVAASLDGAQRDTPLVTSTGAMTDTPLRGLPVSMVVIPKASLRAQSALPLEDATYYAFISSLFDMSPLARLHAAHFLDS